MAQKVKASDSDAELRAAFEVFDKDGSGTINAQELFQVMKSIGEDFTEAQIDEMLKEADHDGNGTIDCKFFSRRSDTCIFASARHRMLMNSDAADNEFVQLMK